MRDPDQENRLVSRENLDSSKNQNKSSQISPKINVENFEEAKKKTVNNGRRRRHNKSNHKALKLDSNSVLSPPAPCKGLVFHKRPGYGQLGTKCVVKANHFLAQMSISDLFHYSVSIA